MPNHITNRITIEHEKIEDIQALMRNGENNFDFNQLIPMPKCLQDFEPHGGVLDRAKNAIGVAPSEAPMIAGLERANRGRVSFEPANTETIKAVIRALQNYIETEYSYWYDWSCDAWGTKWNAYSVGAWENNTIIFDTAWAGVPKIICALSERFPTARIFYTYADEDSGNNVGEMLIEAGKVVTDNSPENGSSRAYEIYLELNPDCDYVKKIDGVYQYVDTEAN